MPPFRDSFFSFARNEGEAKILKIKRFSFAYKKPKLKLIAHLHSKVLVFILYA